MSTKPKLTIVVRPWEMSKVESDRGFRHVTWSATAIFDSPLPDNGVRVVNVEGFSRWHAINKLLDQSSVAKYLQSLEDNFIKEKSIMAKDTATKAALAEGDTETVKTDEIPAVAPEPEPETVTETTPEAEPAPAAAALVYDSPQAKRVYNQVKGLRSLAEDMKDSIHNMLGKEKVSEGVDTFFAIFNKNLYFMMGLAEQAEGILTGQTFVDNDGDVVNS